MMKLKNILIVVKDALQLGGTAVWHMGKRTGCCIGQADCGQYE